MQEPVFTYDVFLSHSPKDKSVARPLAERLRQDGLKVWFDELERYGDPVEQMSGTLWEESYAKRNEEALEHSRVLVFCMSANALGSECAQLEAGTRGKRSLRFRDPLNQERRFIPLRLDDVPVKGSWKPCFSSVGPTTSLAIHDNEGEARTTGIHNNEQRKPKEPSMAVKP